MLIFRSKARGKRSGSLSAPAMEIPAPSASRPHIGTILRGPAPQAKPEVSRPGDACEQEADQVADSIMRMPAESVAADSPDASRRTSEPEIQRACAHCEEEKDKVVNPKSDGGGGISALPSAAVSESGLGGGRSLPPSARSFFEPRFGRDFENVRVHTDTAAAVAARNLNAHAFTLGNHIAFAPGQYSPESESGKKLLAHELTHVVQQGGQGKSVRRKDAGTYISTIGPKDYLDGATGYFEHWGYPRIQKVSTVEEIVRDLSGQSGTIDSFHIVSHGLPGGLEMGLTKKFSPDFFSKDTTEFQTPQAFRTQLGESRLLSDSVIADFLAALRKDKTAGPLLAAVGIGAADPANDSSMGLLIRSVLETEYLARHPQKGDDAVPIKNLGVLNQFNASRLGAFKKAVVADTPEKDRKDFSQNLDKLIAEIPAALQRGKKSFGLLSQSEADSVADPFLDPNSKSPALRPDIQESIAQGSGQGSFLKDLAKVKGLLTSNTHIEIRGCSIGQNVELLDDIRGFFGTPGNLPSISAPDLFQYFFGLHSFQGYGTNDKEKQRLKNDFADGNTGIAAAFETNRRIRLGEMLPTVEAGETVARFCDRYGLKLEDVLAYNPEFEADQVLPVQTRVWLAARQVPAGSHKDLSDFCADVLGNPYLWPKIWGYNPQIKKGSLDPTDKIWLAPASHRKQVVTAAPTADDFSAFLKSGQALVFSDSTDHPTVDVDSTKKEGAMGSWLESQQYDYRHRDANALGAGFGGDFANALMRSYINFLSFTYPAVTDPIFPDDPRYKGHIIRRP